MRRAVALIVAIAAGGAVRGHSQTSPEPLAGLDAYVERVRQDWRAPGIALAVVKDDEVVVAKGYGVRTIGEPAPVDEHTLFAIASTTKAFTAAALAMLVDAGRLGWDDRVVDRLPGFRLDDPYASQELRVRDLLSHRSGLPRGDRLWYASPFDRNEVLHRTRFLESASSFRSRYGYQNIMFLAAGELVPAVTDTTWDEFLRVRIFEPLGMERTRTTVRGLERLDNLATPHGTIDGDVVPIPWRNFDNLGGAGSIVSSVADMAQWIRLQLGEGDYEGRRLLSDSVVREMRTAQTALPISEGDQRLFPETHLQAYGLGWFLQDYRGRLVVRHSGSLDGMRTHVILLPEEELGVVAITNIAESRVPQAVAWHVVDRYLEERDKDWNALLLGEAERARAEADSARARREAARLEGTAPSHPLEELAGRYESPLFGTALVELRPEGLALAIGPSYVGRLDHWHLNTFRAVWDDRYLGTDWVGFRLDRMSGIAGLDVEGFGAFERVREPASVP
jgi:CubicO group peptidase (beta-lactamase class C family)